MPSDCPTTRLAWTLTKDGWVYTDPAKPAPPPPPPAPEPVAEKASSWRRTPKPERPVEGP